jgi:hypothetical protein
VTDQIRPPSLRSSLSQHPRILASSVALSTLHTRDITLSQVLSPPCRCIAFCPTVPCPLMESQAGVPPPPASPSEEVVGEYAGPREELWGHDEALRQVRH